MEYRYIRRYAHSAFPIVGYRGNLRKTVSPSPSLCTATFMDDHTTGNNNTVVSGGGPLETSKSERHVWLMKCPPMVSRSLQQQSLSYTTNEDNNNSSGPAAKVIVAVDPLLPNNDFSSTQVSPPSPFSMFLFYT